MTYQGTDSHPRVKLNRASIFGLNLLLSSRRFFLKNNFLKWTELPQITMQKNEYLPPWSQLYEKTEETKPREAVRNTE